MFVLLADPTFKLQASPRLHPTCSLLSTQSTQHVLLALSTTLMPPGLSLLFPPHGTPPPSSGLNLSMTLPTKLGNISSSCKK
ncbi:hypothetical protein K503DRAFT_778149 [Rhizopogon vinicolor AM-OR11-026]|uniref:Uncharacterized protein n=1 Tax=Rhizopogon vinicolor AM-OR11-026 TaxID=1314800 RepID=A0A1B7MD35_9AGAM|nr:hypothetical protein K503DRAFT_778149 [Rhizopogon vinicolor AM-OR11-026]